MKPNATPNAIKQLLKRKNERAKVTLIRQLIREGRLRQAALMVTVQQYHKGESIDVGNVKKMYDTEIASNEKLLKREPMLWDFNVRNTLTLIIPERNRIPLCIPEQGSA